MLKWAEHEFRLSKTDNDGVSVREHLEKVEKQTGHTPDDLKNPTEFPSLLGSVWSLFLSLHKSRPMGMGPSGIPYTEIQAYCNLTGVVVSPYEVELIKKLDDLFLLETQ